MKRRPLLLRIGGACGLLAARGARAGDVRATVTIGVLQTASLTTNASARTMAVLRESLRAHGLVEARNLNLVLRSAEGRPEALPALALELARWPVQVLCAFGPAAVRAAAAASRTVPIVALDLESDPVLAGWARTLSHPAGNVTGLFLNLPQLAGKWLELLRELMPRLQRVGALWDATTGPAQADAMREAAKRTGVEMQVHALRNIDEMPGALDAALTGGAQALALLSSPLTRNASQQVASFVIRHRLPAISPFRAFVDAGGLMSYGPDLDYFFARTAAFADKIVRGVKPGDLPIEQPTKFELVISTAAGRALGLSIPRTLLLRADEVMS